MWLGIRREDLIKTKPTDGSDDPNDPNAGAVV
jgi:preprotein translocase subunit SecF